MERRFGVRLAGVVYAGGDGSSPDAAVVVRNLRTPFDCLLAELHWLADHRPGAAFVRQERALHPTRSFDFVWIRTGGRLERVVFDVTDAYAPRRAAGEDPGPSGPPPRPR